MYLDAAVIDPGDEKGVGKTVNLYTKGWLPSTPRWQLRVTETNRPCGSIIQAAGDLTCCGVWSFQQDGPVVNVTYH